MRTWFKREFADICFWISVVSSVGCIAYGYATIRSSQVRVEEKTTAVEVRLDKISGRLDNLIDLHLREAQQQGASYQPPGL